MGFLVGGITGNGFVALVLGIALLVGMVLVITARHNREQARQ